MNYKLFTIYALFFLAFFGKGYAVRGEGELLKKNIYLQEDIDIFKKYVAILSPYKSNSLNDIIIKTALFFKDCPYVAHTLEKDPEQLVINLRELDCTTFVETVLALSRTIKLYPDPTFESFCGELQKIRYRKGEIKDYTSRLHYFSDWIYENERNGIVSDVTGNIGGKPCMLSVSYMSSHPQNYRQLKEHSDYIPVIAEQEKEISGRKNYSIIPKEKITSCEKGVRDGDIVCFTTDIKGLDISHVGFMYFKNGKLTFIHASSKLKKVVINPEPLIDYISEIKNNNGIMVVRPLIKISRKR